MASIRKRGSRWHAQIRRNGYPPQSKTFSSKSAAQSWARQLESEMDRGSFSDRTSAEQTTLLDALLRYKAEVLPTKRSQIQISSMIKLISHGIGHYSLANLNSQVIAEYRDQRLLSVGSQTVKHEIGVISRTINVAMKEWGITLPMGNPVQYVSMPRIPAGRERRLVEDEEERLRTTLSHSPLICNIISFALETAMRRGEIASMRWQQVNLKTRMVHLPVTKTNTPRYVPLSTHAHTILNRLPRRIDNLVWGVRSDSITQAFMRACKRANIENLRFHDLRHEATSRLFERGLSMMEVASITGHKDLRMLRRYTHLRTQDLIQKLG